MWHGSAVHQRVDSVNPNLERILWLFDVAQAGEADGMVVSERARESDYLDPLLVFFFQMPCKSGMVKDPRCRRKKKGKPSDDQHTGRMSTGIIGTLDSGILT